MRYTTFTDDEARRMIDECWRALAQGTIPLSELTDHLLSLDGFDFLRTRLANRGRRVAMNSVGNPLSMDERFSFGPTFVDADGHDDNLSARIDIALNGRVFTTQVSTADAVTGSLSLDTDLIAFSSLLHTAGEFTVNGQTGSRTFDQTTGRCELRGGLGWLDDFPPGSLLTVVWVGGDVRVAVHDGVLAPGAAETEALLRYANAERDGHGFIVYDPIIEQVTCDPTAFVAAVPPVSELLLAGGFEQRNGWFGRAGTEWHPPDIAEELELRAYIVEEHGFGSCCCDAFDELLELWHLYLLAKAESRQPDIDYGRVGQLLAHAAVADGLDKWLTRTYGTGPDARAVVGELLVEVVNYGDGSAASAAQYLLGKSLERSGQFDYAARLYEMALASDHSYTPPCLPLAWLAFDRSEFGRARELLTRSGLEPRSREFSFLPRRVGGRSKPRRNACCPCGSGRKYKMCHAGTSVLSPCSRLQLKHDRHAAVAKKHATIGVKALIACDFDEDMADRFRGDEFLADVHRFEGNGLARFVDTRGSLFPCDERELADQLLDTQRSLYEVINIDNGLWLQDVAHDGLLISASTDPLGDDSHIPQLRVGDRILARLLPTAGEAASIIGAVLVVPADAEPSLREVLSTCSTALTADDDDVDRRDREQRLAAWYVTIASHRHAPLR